MALMVTLILLCFPGITSALDVQRDVLDNGLVVLHAEKDSLPIVMVTIVIRASLMDERAEKAGLANLTATMLTEGTKNRSAEQISEEIEFIGASIGASVNDDYTIITLSVLKKDIEKGFDIVSDILLNPEFPEEDLKNKKRLIKGTL